jgi:hypothetical protein
LALSPDEIYDEVVSGFGERKYAAGLAVAFIDFLRALKVPTLEIANFNDFLKKFPRKEFRSPGKLAATLMVELENGRSLTIRPFYNAIETYFRAQSKGIIYMTPFSTVHRKVAPI